MSNFKKRNQEKQVIDVGPQGPTLPRTLPPLRTFVVRTFDADGDRSPNGYMERTIEAHGVQFDEGHMVSFVVFFFLDGAHTQPAQAQKLVLNSDAWTEVEEINLLFPVLEKQ